MSQAAVAIRVYDCALDPWQDHVDVCERWVVEAIAEEGRDIQSPAIQALEGEVISRADAAALQAQQQCLDSYQRPVPQAQTGVHVAVATRMAQGRVETSGAAPSKVLVGRTSVAFAEGGGCPAYPMAMFVTDAKEEVIFFSPEATLKVIDSAPDTCFHLGNTQTGRAWEFVATPTPLPGNAFRGSDGVIYAGIWQNATNPPTAENSIELDAIEFIPNRLAVVIPRYGVGVEPDVHVPAALGMARVTGSKAAVPLAIRPPLTGAIPIGTAGIKLEEVSAHGVTSVDAQLPLWQNGSQVFTKDALGVTPAKFKRRILNSGENTYRVILLTIAWASRYDVYADLYTVKAGRTFSKYTSSVLYIPGQTVGDLPIPPLTEKAFFLRDLAPDLVATLYRYTDHYVVHAAVTLTNPTPFPVVVRIQLSLSTGIRLVPNPIVRIAPQQTITVFGYLPGYSYQNPVSSVTISGTLAIYEQFAGDTGGTLQFERVTSTNQVIGWIDCSGASVTASFGQIVHQQASPPVQSLLAVIGPDAGSAFGRRHDLSISHYWANSGGTTWGGGVLLHYELTNGQVIRSTQGFTIPFSVLISAMTQRGFSFAPSTRFPPYLQVYVTEVFSVPNVYVAKAIGSSPGGPFVAANDVLADINAAVVQAAQDYLAGRGDVKAVYQIEPTADHALFFLNPMLQFNTGNWSGACPASLTSDLPATGLTFLC